MTLFSKLRDALLRPRTSADERPKRVDQIPMRVDELPPFNVQIADLMRYDPQVRIGLGARNGLLMAAEVEVTGDEPEVVAWVQRQWQRIWCTAAGQLLRAKHYGFLPFEVRYRLAKSGGRELLEFDRLLDRHPADVRLLMQDDQPVGFTLREPGKPDVDLLAPQALVVTFDAECGNPYGCALLARAYPAWYEKWMDGGVKRTLRLRMIKDAYIGDIFWYPPDRKVQLADGTEVSWRDIGRDIVAARQTGGALTLPLLMDKDGRKLVDYTPPQAVGGYTQIFHWKRDIDLEIWKALEVPPEIIQASTSGSGFSGRWIPFVVALSAVHLELSELLRCLDRDLLRPLAHLNFGHAPRYDIQPKSLVETYAAKFGNKDERP